jgi:tetratricopeptide (TPR) repeat protein
MSARRRKRLKSRTSNPPGSELQKAAAPKPFRPKLNRRRKWLFRLATVILAPLLFFMLLEAVLRLADYGHPTAFFLGPDADGTYKVNPQFGWRFFPRALARTPIPSFITAKPAGAVRIFVLGSSAAQGVPNPSFSFGRILEVMLRARYPGVQFEVVNTAMTAINSHVTREIARDCAAQQPDLFIVYMGNNEVVGPYGPGTVFQQWSPSLKFIRANIWLKSTRTGQLMENAVRYFHANSKAPSPWRGMEMFLGNQVAADDPRLEAVYVNFRQNLVDICSVAQRAGAAIVLSTIVVNIKDCPPFASLHRSDLSAEALTKWKSIYEAGVGLEAKEKWPEALAQYEAASRIDDCFAELQFRKARCLAAENRFTEARERFVSARDLDVFRFRADSKINEVIREVAAAQKADGIQLVDAEQSLGGRDAATNGIPGADLFYEHVHLTFEGNYRLARAMLDRVCTALPQLASRKEGPVLTKEQCAESLTLTPWDEYQSAELMRQMNSRPPFTNQLDHATAYASLREHMQKLNNLAFTPQALQAACRAYETALKKTPEDLLLRHRFGKLLMACGQGENAADQLRIVLKNQPWEPMVYIDLGSALQMGERTDEAIRQYRKALEIDPANLLAHNNLGQALDKRGQTNEAIAQFEKALEIDPELATAHYNLGVILSRSSSRMNEAITHYQKALEIDPKNATAYINLGVLLNGRGQTDAAIAQYQKALEINSNSALAHNNIGNALNNRGQTDSAMVHYRKAVAIDPRLADARRNLGGMLANQGMIDEAIVHFQKVVEIEPRNAEAYYTFGRALAIRGRIDDAILNFQKALEIRPDFADARKDLNAALMSRPHGSK